MKAGKPVPGSPPKLQNTGVIDCSSTLSWGSIMSTSFLAASPAANTIAAAESGAVEDSDDENAASAAAVSPRT